MSYIAIENLHTSGLRPIANNTEESWLLNIQCIINYIFFYALEHCL